MSMLTRRSLVILFAASIVVIAGGLFIKDQLTGIRPSSPRQVRYLPMTQTRSWNESHPTFEMHAQPVSGQRDTAFVSRAIAVLPVADAARGTKLHFLVTVPNWAVYDEAGKLLEGGDGVIITADNPDLGIGLELTRLELNPGKRSSDRKWHAFDVTVPPCTRRIALEVLPGTEVTANNWFDRVHVSPPQGLEFRRPRMAGAAGSQKLSGCTETARDSGNRLRAGRSAGSLHTGQRP